MYLVSPYEFAVLTLAAAAVCVISEWRHLSTLRAASKALASTSFIAFAVVNGAFGSIYGRLILAALVLSWLGDLLLLSLRESVLMGGIAAFLLAHIAFAAAFLARSLDLRWLTVSAVFLIGVGVLLLRWLWPHLEPRFRIAVGIYILAILSMTSLAMAVSGASSSPLIASGAIAFLSSDISVARDRFVSRDIVNRVWGLPLYYAAQVMFAASVLSFR